MNQKTEALAPFAPLLVNSRSDIAGALIARRHALGWTGEDLDERAGWADRLSGKMEAGLRPSGRIGFHFLPRDTVLPTGAIRPSQMGDVWCAALGVRLVLVDAATAKAIGAMPAPDSPPPPPPFGHTGPSHAARRRLQGKKSAMTVEAYAVSDRTAVAAHSFRVAVVDHPWLEKRPELKARAEFVAKELQDLATDIGEAA